MSNKIAINVDIDLDDIKKTIDEAKDLNENAEFFSRMAQIARIKKDIDSAVDVYKSLESDVKGMINGKAKAIYGDNWSAIAGNGYKISRSMTGSVYAVDDVDKAKNYIKVEVKPDSDKIDKFIKAESKLPPGLSYNPDRGEQIRITVK